MFGLRLKSIRLCVTLCFVLVILCAAGGKEGDPRDVATDGGKEGDPRDVATDDVKDTDPKDVAKEGATDKKSKGIAKPDLSNKDQVTQLLESLSPEDVAKLENMTDEEAEKLTAFLSPEEGCDFLGMGPLFDDPDYHKDLLHDYVTMERFGYWEMRCEEFAYKDTADPNVKDTNVKDTAVQKPSYCT